MILRSIGRTLEGDRNRLRNFKIKTYLELESLLSKMERNKLKEENIIFSIEKISKKCGISFGQSQKAINVILKYHYYLCKKYIDYSMKKILHCPVDSIILGELSITEPLARIDKEQYLEIQQRIAKKVFPKINFDKKWDKQHLKNGGIL